MGKGRKESFIFNIAARELMSISGKVVNSSASDLLYILLKICKIMNRKHTIHYFTNFQKYEWLEFGANCCLSFAVASTSAPKSRSDALRVFPHWFCCPLVLYWKIRINTLSCTITFTSNHIGFVVKMNMFSIVFLN